MPEVCASSLALTTVIVDNTVCFIYTYSGAWEYNPIRHQSRHKIGKHKPIHIKWVADLQWMMR